MKLHFRWYMFCCYVTHPIRWVMDLIPFWYNEYNHRYFAIKWLFGNEFKVNFVLAQAAQESGQGVMFGEKYKSFLAENYHNWFGMGFTTSSQYQDGSWNSGKVGEPVFATYKNDYKGIYDFYNYAYERKKWFGSALDRANNYQNFEAASQTNKNYVAYVVGNMQAYKYFTGNADTYASNIYSIEQGFPPLIVPYRVNIISTLVLVAVALCYVRRLYLLLVSTIKSRSSKQKTSKTSKASN